MRLNAIVIVTFIQDLLRTCS